MNQRVCRKFSRLLHLVEFKGFCLQRDSATERVRNAICHIKRDNIFIVQYTSCCFTYLQTRTNAITESTDKEEVGGGSKGI